MGVISLAVVSIGAVAVVLCPATAPLVAPYIGVGALGPVAGGAFAATQATLVGGVAAGSWMAAAQSVIMGAAVIAI